MPRLIRIENKEANEITHSKCGAVIRYFDNEAIKGTHHDYGGGSEIYYYIFCPNSLCEEKVEVDAPKD